MQQRKLLNVWYQESRCVIQQAAEATTKASFKERGVLQRGILRQQAPGIITAGPACTETSAISPGISSCCVQVHLKAAQQTNKHVAYVNICQDVDIEIYDVS